MDVGRQSRGVRGYANVKQEPFLYREDECTPLEPPLSPASSIGLPPCYDYKKLNVGRQKEPRVKEAGQMFKKFLDVDVMKSVTDLNCKPKQKFAAKHEFLNVLLLPLYKSFWLKLLTQREYTFYAVLFILEAVSCCVYTLRVPGDGVWEDLSASEVYFAPLCLLFTGLVFGRIPTSVQKTPGRQEEDDRTAATRKFPDTISEDDPDDTDEDEDDAPPVGVDDEEVDALQCSTRSQSGFLATSSSSCSLDKDEASSEVYSPGSDSVRVDTVNVLLWGDSSTIHKTPEQVLSDVWEAKPGQLHPYKFTVSVMQVRNAILRKVEETNSRRHAALDISFWAAVSLALLPTMHRVFTLQATIFSYLNSIWYTNGEVVDISELYDVREGNTSLRYFQSEVNDLLCHPTPVHTLKVLSTILLHPSSPNAPLHHSLLAAFVVATSAASVFVLTRKMVSHLALAEQTYHKRYLYAKFFSALTSLRRSQRYNLPHFRLKNVENVMAWLALRGSRAWLRLEPQEIAADSCVSLTFQVFLLTVAVVGMLVVQEATEAKRINKGTTIGVERFSEVMHGQIFLTSVVLSYYLLHFMMIGTSINHKYGNSSLLLTEQINLHLRMVAVSGRTDARIKDKKERLALTNKVLELAAKLLKELEGPNKISGLSMNPLLYNITRVMVLSCLSAAFSHIVGFTPKLWKI